MVSWNYRLVDFGTHISVCEVYYDDDGEPIGRTGAIRMSWDSEKEATDDLRLILKSIEGKPTLIAKEIDAER